MLQLSRDADYMSKPSITDLDMNYQRDVAIRNPKNNTQSSFIEGEWEGTLLVKPAYGGFSMMPLFPNKPCIANR